MSILITLFLIVTDIYTLAGHFIEFDYFLVNILLALVVVSALIAAKMLFGMWRQKKR